MAVSITKSQLKKMGIKVEKSTPKGRMEPQSEVTNKDVISLEFPFKPKPKSRPRTVINPKDVEKAFFASKGNVGKFMSLLKPKTISTKETREFENKIKNTAKILMGRRKPFEVPVVLNIEFYIPGKENMMPTSVRDGDIDNHQKSILDALNQVLYEDDRLIVELNSKMICEEGSGRIIIQAYPATHSKILS